MVSVRGATTGNEPDGPLISVFRARRTLLLAGALLPVVLAGGGGVLVAQSTTGSLTGLVIGPDGQPAPGATVVAHSPETGAERGTVSGRDGRYRFDGLQPGAWMVSARLADGPPGPERRAEVGLQDTIALDLPLAATVTENVTVSAAAPMIDRERTGGELSVGQDMIADLPINGRQLTDLALLDSSVRPSAPESFYGERGTVFVLNGQSGRANSFLVDGLDNNDLTSNTTLNAPFSTQVIKDFKVLTHQFAPEFGRAAGGVLNIVTRQGTNDRHLEFFAQGVGRNLGHEGEFVSGLPNTDDSQTTSGRFQTGFTYSGPFQRDRSFYFLSYEHGRQDNVVPFTGVGRDGVAGGITNGADRDDNLFFRTDVGVGDASTLMTRLSADTRHAEDLLVGGHITPESGFSANEHDVQLASSLTTVLSPTLLNEARILVGTSQFDQAANSSRPGVDRPSGEFGGNTLNEQNRGEDRVQMVDDVTWQKGNHALKFGVDVIRSRTDIATRFNPNGSFSYQTDKPFEPGDRGDLNASDVNLDQPYAPIYVGQGQPGGEPNGIDDDGDGIVDEPGIIGTYPEFYELVEGAPAARINDTRLGAFAQDSYRAGERWVLDYGLRYDLSTFHLPGSLAIPSSIPNGGAPIDKNNVAPRFGFTFSPDGGGWLVRGGAGMFYDKIVFSFPAVAAITSGTQIGLLLPQGTALEITENVVEEVGIDTIKEGLVFPPELTLRFSTGTTLDTPYAMLYNLGVEHRIGERATFSINATRSLGYHQILSRDLNPVVDPNPGGVPIHVDRTTGSIAAFVSDGRSWYSGLDLGWRWRGRRNWLSFSYTLSKTLDMGPDPLQGGFYLPPDSTDLSGEKARSDNDRRHRAVLAGTTMLPWGGLLTSWMVQAMSGAPFNVTSGKDDNVDGFLTDRPGGVGRNAGASVDLAAVNALRADPFLGLQPVTHVKEPNFVQVDLRLAKPFPMGEDRHGQAYLQVFNLFDRFNGGPVDGVATSRTFGEPVGQIGPPLTVEAGVALFF